jgi:hypothetical protein
MGRLVEEAEGVLEGPSFAATERSRVSRRSRRLLLLDVLHLSSPLARRRRSSRSFSELYLCVLGHSLAVALDPPDFALLDLASLPS